MSSSPPIDFRGVFVLVGGPSGAGKTTTINALLNASALFRRPTSYTTRQKRINEDTSEYHFVSSCEIDELYHSGLLANYDIFRDRAYGISKTSLDEMLLSGINVIKEIHPANMRQFADSYPSVVTVLIDNVATADAHEWVGSEWHRYALECDIFLNRAGMTPADSAAWLARALVTHFAASKSFPAVQQCEALNRAGYDIIAEEFHDKFRPTTSAFHRSSTPALLDLSLNLLNDGPILEIGPGTGWLQSLLGIDTIHFSMVDIASNMQRESLPNYFVTPARVLPFAVDTFDVVLCSLADAILTPQTILEIARVLRPGGHFIYSSPTSVWARSLRDGIDLDRTSFVRRDGAAASVYSFAREFESLLPAFQLSGLHLDNIRYCFPKEETDSNVHALTAAATKLGYPLMTIPIVYVASLVKGGEVKTYAPIQNL